MDGAGRIVAMLNQKGGVGKTTSTVNLGAALAESGLRVLLVDLDPQANLSLHFGLEPTEETPTVYDLLLDPESRAGDAIIEATPRLHFIPSVTALALAEGALAAKPEMQRTLERALAPVRDRYDIILLDCPPSLGVLTVNALTIAHEVIVPMQAQYLALRGLEKLLSTVHLVSQGLNPALRVRGILLCMHESQSSHGKAVVDEMQAHLEQYRGSGLPWASCEVLLPPVRRNVKLAEAPSFGKTIFDYAPACAGAQDYRALAAGLAERWAREGAPPPQVETPVPAPSRGEADGREPDAAEVPAHAGARSGGISLG